MSLPMIFDSHVMCEYRRTCAPSSVVVVRSDRRIRCDRLRGVRTLPGFKDVFELSSTLSTELDLSRRQKRESACVTKSQNKYQQIPSTLTEVKMRVTLYQLKRLLEVREDQVLDFY